ncbi:MAG: carboxypeptidase regulatory-like domain-containing protein [Candidatus Latescibacteria bacterium]|jgi:hypothetical protein|nr:carboxypeptidase regulatory-like domain-containing protein [Candidatus Latescibacterota bacterium]
MHRQSHISIPHKLFSVAILTLCITILLVYSCDKDKDKSIVGPVEDTFTISGKVLQATGLVSSRGIDVTIIGTGVEDSTKTDSMGVYSFDGLPAGEYTITPTREGYYFPLSTEVIIIDSNVEVDNFYYWLITGNADESIIVGKILDSDENPIWGVDVKIIPQQHDQKSVGRGSTNSYGFYWASGNIIRNKSYRVIPDKNGYNYTFSPDTAYVNITELFTEVNFIATNSGEPLHSISGRIVDTDGNGVFNPRIYINEENKKEHRSLSTDKDGFYTFQGLKDGTYILQSGGGDIGIAREYIVVDGGDVIMPDIVLSYRGPTKYEFSGSVLNNIGNGIPGVQISFLFISMETDSEGLYTTEEIDYNCQVDEREKSKQISFIPSKSGFSFTPDTTWVTIGWQKDVEFAEITVPDIIGFDWGVYRAEDYFPLGTGSSWIYERTIGSQESNEHTISVTGSETVNGMTYTVMSSNYSEYFSAFRIENNTVNALSNDEDVAYLKFGVVKGSEWVVDRIRENALSATFIDIESASVPAGIFEDCLHFELNLPLGDISYEKTDLWFERDIGLVRAEKVVVSMGEVMETVTDELKSY